MLLWRLAAAAGAAESCAGVGSCRANTCMLAQLTTTAAARCRDDRRRDDRDRRRDDGRGGGEDRGRGRSAWDATPSRRAEADEWETTPSRGGGGGGSLPPSGSRRPSSVRDTPLAGRGSSWDAAAAAPESARSGAGGGTGAYKPRSSVRFDVERSPALTPAWHSSSWEKQRGPKPGERRSVERSPDLAPDRNAEVRRGGGVVWWHAGLGGRSCSRPAHKRRAQSCSAPASLIPAAIVPGGTYCRWMRCWWQR